MCFGGSKPKITKAPPAPQVQIPQQPAIESTVPRTQSGADAANAGQATQKRKKSLFQIDLTIPTSTTQQQQQNLGSQSSDTMTGPVIK